MEPRNCRVRRRSKSSRRAPNSNSLGGFVIAASRNPSKLLIAISEIAVPVAEISALSGECGFNSFHAWKEFSRHPTRDRLVDLPTRNAGGKCCGRRNPRSPAPDPPPVAIQPHRPRPARDARRRVFAPPALFGAAPPPLNALSSTATFTFAASAVTASLSAFWRTTRRRRAVSAVLRGAKAKKAGAVGTGSAR